MTKKQRNLNILAIYLVAFLQMGGAGLSPVMAALGNAFPSASPSQIQLVMTIPSLFVVLTNLTTGYLMEKFPKKYLTAIGCSLAVLFAILGSMINGSLAILYVWAGILGVATSLSTTVSQGIINDMFEAEERVQIFGRRTAAASVGTMLMTFVGGYLVAINWKYGFLVYLIMLPALVACLVCHPRNTKIVQNTDSADASEKPFSVKALIFPCIAGFMASFLYSSAMTNNSMLVAEMGAKGMLGGMDPNVLGGYLTTIILIVGAVLGMVLDKIANKIGLQCMSLGFVLLAVGYAVIFFANGFAMLVIAAIIMGGALNCIMPHATILGSDAGGAKAELGLSLAIGCANLGTLVSAVIPAASSALFGTDEVRFRYLFAACVAAIVAAALIVYISRKYKGKKA